MQLYKWMRPPISINGSEAEGNADDLQVPNLYCSGVDPLKASALSEAMTSTNTSGLPSDSLRISSTGQIQSPVTDETESKNVLSSSINQSDEIFQSADERSHIPLDLPSTSEFNSHVIEGKQEGPEANSTSGSSLHSFYEDFGARLDQTAENVAQSHDEEIEVSDAREKSEGANPLQDENEMDVEAIDEEISEPSIISEKIPAKRAFTRSMGFINEDPDWQRWVGSTIQKTSPKKIKRMLQGRVGRVTRRSYKCSICGKDYRSISSLKSHLSTHIARMCENSNGSSKFHCGICHKLCKSKAGLSSHIKTHAKDAITLNN